MGREERERKEEMLEMEEVDNAWVGLEEKKKEENEWYEVEKEELDTNDLGKEEIKREEGERE